MSAAPAPAPPPPLTLVMEGARGESSPSRPSSAAARASTSSAAAVPAMSGRSAAAASRSWRTFGGMFGRGRGRGARGGATAACRHAEPLGGSQERGHSVQRRHGGGAPADLLADGGLVALQLARRRGQPRGLSRQHRLHLVGDVLAPRAAAAQVEACL
jgi:hypothetical protein